MNIFEFMSESPILTGIIVIVIGCVIESISDNRRKERQEKTRNAASNKKTDPQS
jgi:hypothetical protein